MKLSTGDMKISFFVEGSCSEEEADKFVDALIANGYDRVESDSQVNGQVFVVECEADDQAMLATIANVKRIARTI